MYIGASIVSITVGAILTYAISDRLSGVDLDAVGVILMVAGAIGLLVSLFLAARARDRRGDAAPAYPDERYVAPRERVVERERYRA